MKDAETRPRQTGPPPSESQIGQSTTELLASNQPDNMLYMQYPALQILVLVPEII